jgi:hypothetical protein
MGWISMGELKAINVGTATKPRFLVTPEQLAQFLRGRQVVVTTRAPSRRRRRAAGMIDFYADD